MTIDFDDTIDFNVMHEPPTFVTTVRADEGTTVVITNGNDFPGVVVEWPEQMAEERAEDFWSLGTLHLCEVELTKLPADVRAEAMLSVQMLERDDPRGLAGKVASIIREVMSAHPGIVKPTFKLTKDELEAYRRLLIIRATGPYTGPDTVSVMNISGGMIAA